jgi:hypothetical protein
MAACANRAVTATTQSAGTKLRRHTVSAQAGGLRGKRMMFESQVSSQPDCHRCGSPLLGDPDDEPDGGADGLPMCGECSRNRDEEADFAMMDMRDGELDGIIEW